jgi:hypothetical protein
MKYRFYTGLKKFTFIILLAPISVILFTGCESQDGRYSNVEDLRDAFVESGGQCWEWKTNDPIALKVPIQLGNAQCDEKTVLIIFSDEVSARKEALSFASQLRALDFDVSLLFGDNWMINSDQVKEVAKGLGGTLVTR